MKQTETTSKRKRIFELIGTIGPFFFAGCLPIFLEVLALILYLSYSWPFSGLRNLLRFFYLPQFGVITLTTIFIIGLVFTVKNHNLRKWKTYIPLIMLVIYGLVVTAASCLTLDYSIRTKIIDPDGRVWSDAMVGRALGGYPTGLTCRLSPKVVVLAREWSFVTPDGHMPVLAWSESSVPTPELLGNPMNCAQLQPNWYVCYLAKPYQLIAEDHICG
jgi:hypothetical protein